MSSADLGVEAGALTATQRWTPAAPPGEGVGHGREGDDEEEVTKVRICGGVKRRKEKRWNEKKLRWQGGGT